MQRRLRYVASGVGGLALVCSLLGTTALGASADAATATTSFAGAKIKAYSSGEVLHLGGLDLTSTAVADSELGYATSSIDSAGLTAALRGDASDGSLLIQPAQKAGVKAYGSGDGIVADLSASSPSDNIVPGLATQTSPPINNTIDKTTEVPTSGLLPGGLLDTNAGQGTNVLQGQANANYPGTCPIGRPIAYGAGTTNDANVVSSGSVSGLSSLASSLNGVLGPVETLVNTLLTTAGLPTLSASATADPELIENNGTTQTLADTYLSPNGNGTWGVSSFESVEPSPIRINLLGLAQINISLAGANTGSGAVPSPLRLVATSTGSHGSVALQDTDVVDVTATVLGQTINLTPGGAAIGKTGVDIPLSLGGTGGLLTTALGKIPALGGILSTVTNLLPDVSLGSITIGGPIQSTVSGSTASGSYDLAHVDIAPDVAGTTTNVLDLALDHMETSASLNEAIHCSIPTAVTSSAGRIAAGKSATLTVKTGASDSMAGLLACTIKPATVTEHVTSPTARFSLANPSAGGRAHRVRAGDWTVTWTGKTLAGSEGRHNPGSNPLTLTARVEVPRWSAAGTVETTAAVSGKFANCDNGTAANPYKTIADGVTITGSASHTGPTVTKS